jgi:hypothetical protein
MFDRSIDARQGVKGLLADWVMKMIGVDEIFIN